MSPEIKSTYEFLDEFEKAIWMIPDEKKGSHISKRILKELAKLIRHERWMLVLKKESIKMNRRLKQLNTNAENV